VNGEHQLALFAEPASPERLTKAKAGLRSEMPAGAERLLAELVKRGLCETDLRVAARLCLALDERPQ
jgi:hypothetical protein